VQQKTTKTDSLVPCIEVIQGQIMGWNVIWIGWAERVKVKGQSREQTNYGQKGRGICIDNLPFEFCVVSLVMSLNCSNFTSQV